MTQNWPSSMDENKRKIAEMLRRYSSEFSFGDRVRHLESRRVGVVMFMDSGWVHWCDQTGARYCSRPKNLRKA